MSCQNHLAFDLEAEQANCIDLTLEEESDSWRAIVAGHIMKLDMVDLRYLAYSQLKFQVYKEFQRVGFPHPAKQGAPAAFDLQHYRH